MPLGTAIREAYLCYKHAHVGSVVGPVVAASCLVPDLAEIIADYLTLSREEHFVETIGRRGTRPAHGSASVYFTHKGIWSDEISMRSSNGYQWSARVMIEAVDGDQIIVYVETPLFVDSEIHPQSAAVHWSDEEWRHAVDALLSCAVATREGVMLGPSAHGLCFEDVPSAVAKIAERYAWVADRNSRAASSAKPEPGWWQRCSLM